MCPQTPGVKSLKAQICFNSNLEEHLEVPETKWKCKLHIVSMKNQIHRISEEVICEGFFP